MPLRAGSTPMRSRSSSCWASGTTRHGRGGAGCEVDRGEVLGVEGYRFHKNDLATGGMRGERSPTSFASSPPRWRRGKATSTGTPGPLVAANGVIVTLKAPPDAVLSVATDGGNFRVPLADLALAARRDATSTARSKPGASPAGVPLRDGADQEDFPAAAADARGGAWVAYVVHRPSRARGPGIVPRTPQELRRLRPQGGRRPGPPAPFRRRPGRRADRRDRRRASTSGAPRSPSRATARSSSPGPRTGAATGTSTGAATTPKRRSWSEPKRLTTDPGTDTDVVLATAPDGKVWMAWQGWRDGQADILLAEVEGHRGTGQRQPRRRQRLVARPGVRSGTAAPSSPSTAIGRAITTSSSGPAARLTAVSFPVAATARYEARPSLAIDPRGRAWVAYEERDANWGKDAENLLQGQGLDALPLGRGQGPLRRRRPGARRPRPGRRRARDRSARHEQLSADRRRPRRPDLAGVPAPPRGDLGRPGGDGRRRRLDRVRDRAGGQDVGAAASRCRGATACSTTGPRW